MSAEPQTKPDLGVRAVLFLINVVLALILGTVFFGLSFLLGTAIIGSFVMLGVVIFLSSPKQRV